MVQAAVASHGIPTHFFAWWKTVHTWKFEDSVPAMESVDDDTLPDCKKEILLMDHDVTSQKKENDVLTFLSNLRIKEDVSTSSIYANDMTPKLATNGMAISDLAFSGSHEVEVAADVFTNFDDWIRDCGCGRTYFYAPVLPASGDMVDAVVLSAWDNVVGPKAVFVWSSKTTQEQKEKDNKKPDILQQAIQYTVSHTLHGELEKMNCGNASVHGLEMYVVEDCNFMVCSVSFMAPQAHESVPHSLSVVTPTAKLKRCLELQSLFSLWMQRLACCIRISLHQKDYKLALTELSPNVVEFCELLGSLSTAGLTSVQSGTTADVEMDRRLLKPILGKAITSHLQTCCCTVVIGDSVHEVNCVVQILADFLRPRDRALVRLVLEDTSWPYHPGLLIQGMLKGVRGDTNISAEDVLYSMYPTTIVDLTQEEVRQSWLLHEHVKCRTMRLKQELSALLSNSKPCSTMMQNIFHRVADVSPLVNEFLEKIWTMECELLRRQGLISLFLRKLEYHAFALIRLVQTAMKICGNLSDSQSFPVNRKHLRRQLHLDSEADFLVVLAVAERLQPGIYHTVMQEGATPNDTRDVFRK